MPIHSFGSICSGIEAASFTLQPMGVNALWLSEIAEYPSRFLEEQYPDHPNLGDMNGIDWGNSSTRFACWRNSLSSILTCRMEKWNK